MNITANRRTEATTMAASAREDATLGRRVRTVLACSIAAALMVAAPAVAAPGGPTAAGEPSPAPNPSDLTLVPTDQPDVKITVAPTCVPVVGIEYVIDHHQGLAAANHYEAEWGVDQQIIVPKSVPGKIGVFATGEGDFVVRGHAGYLGPFPEATWSSTSDWEKVTVDCSDDGGEEPEEDPEEDPDPEQEEPEEEPEDGPEVDSSDDDIVTGNPNFTG